MEFDDEGIDFVDPVFVAAGEQDRFRTFDVELEDRDTFVGGIAQQFADTNAGQPTALFGAAFADLSPGGLRRGMTARPFSILPNATGTRPSPLR